MEQPGRGERSEEGPRGCTAASFWVYTVCFFRCGGYCRERSKVEHEILGYKVAFYTSTIESRKPKPTRLDGSPTPPDWRFMQNAVRFAVCSAVIELSAHAAAIKGKESLQINSSLLRMSYRV